MATLADKRIIPAVIAGLNDASLSLTRSLGAKDIPVIGLHDENTRKYYLSSRYLTTRIQTPLSGKGLVDTLLNTVAPMVDGRAALFCATDSSVLTVSEYRDDLMPFYHFVLPSHDVTTRHISKKRFYSFAIENSFPVPKTFFTSSYDDIERVAAEISYPCIIKPEFRDQHWNERVPEKVLFAESKNDFLEQVKKYGIQKKSLAVQEWIDGDDTEVYFSLAYISRSREILAMCTARKLRQYPHLTGSTSVAETIVLPEIARESVRLLMTAGFVGFCSVEYKRSIKSGVDFVTEPTIGRPDTQEGIFISSGVDVPYLAYRDALGHDVQVEKNVEAGIKWINEPLAFYSLQKSAGKRSELKKIFSSLKGVRTYALWSRRDPVPSLLFYGEKLKSGVRRLFRPNVIHRAAKT